jgi:electron transfer flavoprotein-quinone oxidoreductase
MENFDAIVVGAGPAGTASAYVMAKAGLQVLVLERGKYPGAKNMWGGAFYGPVMEELFPDFWNEAPIERYVSRHGISFLTEVDSLSIDFRSQRFEKNRAFIVLRAKFDQWMAKKAEQAGAIIATSLEADDLLYDGSAVVGVKVGPEAFPASVTILADGANSLLAAKAGLRKDYSPHDVKQGVKEVIKLPREVIEERFQLEGDAGAALEFIGACTKGLPGGGFLYTNRDSLSIGLAVQLASLLEHQTKASDLLEAFKNHPLIQGFIRGGETVEYSAHLIPVTGIKILPSLAKDGLLITGDAAGLVLGTGLILEGANFAMASGVAAAETVVRAVNKGDFSQTILDHYEQLLRKRFVLQELQTFKKAPAFLENIRIYTTYPELACSMAMKIFENDGSLRKGTFKALRESMKGKVSIWQLLSDALKAKGAL